MLADLKRPVLQPLYDNLFAERQLEVSVLRLDTIHPLVSGNKWYKLKYNIEAFQQSGKEFLVTFGGAWSNHIVATAAAGKEFGIQTIGIIRGEELNEHSNSCLRFASACGMKLIFVSREIYRLAHDNTIPIDELLKNIKPASLNPKHSFILPEGGAGELAVKGCKEIIQEIPSDFAFICCACGTGTTLAGISAGLSKGQKAIGIPVLHGQFLEKDVLNMNGGIHNFELMEDYHFGGYAKSNPMLEEFCATFSKMHQLPVEPIYTGKLFYGILDLIQKHYFPPSSKLVLVHSGGILQPLAPPSTSIPGSAYE